MILFVFFFKQKTAYEMRISDWSSDVALPISWRMLPPCFPPVSTVRRWFYLWRDNGLWLSLTHALLLIGREAVGREASPRAGLIASQSVTTSASGGPRGYDAAKKIKGPKRSILTATDATMVHAVIPTTANQERHGS